MPGHTGGATGKVSNDLANVKRQLKSGRTCGATPRDLTDDEKKDLKARRVQLEKQLEEMAEQREKDKAKAKDAEDAEAEEDVEDLRNPRCVQKQLQYKLVAIPINL